MVRVGFQPLQSAHICHIFSVIHDTYGCFCSIESAGQIASQAEAQPLLCAVIKRLMAGDALSIGILNQVIDQLIRWVKSLLEVLDRRVGDEELIPVMSEIVQAELADKPTAYQFAQ